MIIDPQQASTTPRVTPPGTNPSSVDEKAVRARATRETTPEVECGIARSSEEEALMLLAKKRHRAEAASAPDYKQSEDEILSEIAKQRRQSDYVSNDDLSQSEDKILSEMAKRRPHADARSVADSVPVTALRSMPTGLICTSDLDKDVEPALLLGDLENKSSRPKVDAELAVNFLAQLVEQRLTRERDKLALKYQRLVEESLDGDQLR